MRACATVIGPVGFADTISTWTRSRSSVRARPELETRRHDLSNAVDEPGVGEPEVDEAGACPLGALRQPALHDFRGDLIRDLARRPLAQARELQRDVRRVVAVLGVGGTLEGDVDARDVRERLVQARDGIRGGRARHAPIVGGLG